MHDGEGLPLVHVPQAVRRLQRQLDRPAQARLDLQLREAVERPDRQLGDDHERHPPGAGAKELEDVRVGQ